jgi:hypothetical protein
MENQCSHPFPISLMITSTSTVYIDQFEQVSIPSPYPKSDSDPIPDPITSKDYMLSTPSPDSLTSADCNLVLDPTRSLNPIPSPDPITLPSPDPIPYAYSMPSEDSKLSPEPATSIAPNPIPSEDPMLQSTNTMPSSDELSSK